MDFHICNGFPDFYPLIFSLLNFSDQVTLRSCNRFFNNAIKAYLPFIQICNFLSKIFEAIWTSENTQFNFYRLILFDKGISLKHLENFVAMDVHPERAHRGNIAIHYLLNTPVAREDIISRKKEMLRTCADFATNKFKIMAKGYFYCSTSLLDYFAVTPTYCNMLWTKSEDFTIGPLDALLNGICADEDPISRLEKAKVFDKELTDSTSEFISPFRYSTACYICQTQDKDLVRALKSTFNLYLPGWRIITSASYLPLQDFLSLDEKKKWTDNFQAKDWKAFLEMARPEISCNYIRAKKLDFRNLYIRKITHPDIIRAFCANGNDFSTTTGNCYITLNDVTTMEIAKVIVDECKTEYDPEWMPFASQEVAQFFATRDSKYHSSLITYAIKTADYQLIDDWANKVDFRSIIKNVREYYYYLKETHQILAYKYIIELMRAQSRRGKIEEINMEVGWNSILYQ